MIRYRVDFIHGYASFSEKEKHKAYEIYNDKSYNALRIRKCDDIFDEGVVVVGSPVYEDRTTYLLQ